MENFFILEGGYLVIALIVLLITLYVTTRPFISKTAMKRSFFSVISVLVILIGGHYIMTTNRMSDVKTAFEEDQPILCESRMQTKVAQFVTIQKSKEWSIKGDTFVSPNYTRAFHSARCITQ